MSNERFYFITILFFFINTFITAQVNVEKYRQNQAQLGFSGSVELDISLNTGNKDVQELGLDGFIDFKSENYLTFLIVRGDYGWQNGVSFSDEALGHLRYIYTSSDPLKLEIFTQFDYNKQRLLLNRYLGGMGLRFNIYETPGISVKFGSAYMIELEKYDLPANSVKDNKVTAHRWSNYLTGRIKLSDNTQIALVVYIQPKITRWKDFRVLTENSLIVNISGSFSLSVGFNLRYDSDLIPDIKDTDTKTKVGLVYQF